MHLSSVSLRGPTALVGEATRAYQPGDTVDESLAPYLSPNGPTLVAALQTTCKFCTDSMPFYRRLASQYEGRLHIVVVTPNSAAATAEYLSGHDLVPSTTVPESPIDGVTGTPTLLLVDDDGTISGTWRGRLNARGEEAVLVALDQAFGVQ
jgi:hypothetical protein